MKTQKKKISQWFIMCDKCHKIIGKKYAKSISNHMRKEVLEDVLRILEQNKDSFKNDIEFEWVKSKLQEQGK